MAGVWSYCRVGGWLSRVVSETDLNGMQLIERSKDGVLSKFYFYSKYLIQISNFAADAKIVFEEARCINECKNNESRQPSIGEQNRRIWERFYPDVLFYANTSKIAPTASVSHEDDEEEDWRPYFLRENPKHVDQEIPAKNTAFPQADEFVIQIRRQAKCHDELSDEDFCDPWFIADDEPRDPVKVTDALLRAWHRTRVT